MKSFESAEKDTTDLTKRDRRKRRVSDEFLELCWYHRDANLWKAISKFVA